ncbi:bacillithiol biosynthesis cysteine-adding enzyme BshC [Staphylococcus arlettae]|uniref:bacillithiol biosynthesis cysteine-adding enzyme BshC n=1 Tax=Staphylococcus arlettae TaxID=29378 RepID=UPI000E69847E|nr:bacillithiol biosynthesis cysteine-adding enzyme BshC [Staphylococcus arlettae]RIM62531.1 bacillithiol biosynthesis cysteine-adding enzyme BshC [Staphylococcus arlettae]
MDCMTTKLNDKDQFIEKIKNSDSTLAAFYNYDAMNEQNYKLKLDQATNGREKAVAAVISNYMEDLSLSEAQENNIAQLQQGAKVIIGGQQAGLFGGPLYTFHKIFSIISLSNSLSSKYNQQVIPVFWIAGEDHDFEEVNHTFTYNNKEAKLYKTKYHTMEPPETSVSNYYPNKLQLKDALKQFLKQQPETNHTKELIELCHSIIERYDSWTDIFKALLHEVFKAYGLLLIDAHNPDLRQIEKPFIQTIIEQHETIDHAFRATQGQTMAAGLNQMIQTNTNVHLFLEEDNMRQLISYENGEFVLTKSDKRYSKHELLQLAEQEPERFSNNVVTRPLMEEWLFNTVAFIGGPSEIKYWAELHGVFNTLSVDMPIVLPRLRISYINERIEKVINKYQLSVDDILTNGVHNAKASFIREHASQTVIDQIEEMKQQQQSFYETIKSEVAGNNDNEQLVAKNNDIHLTQYDYLLKRYLLNIERENAISMKHFNEINESLHPMDGLQERIWNPLQIMNEYGIDVFSPSTYPPIRYTFDHIILKP